MTLLASSDGQLSGYGCCAFGDAVTVIVWAAILSHKLPPRGILTDFLEGDLARSRAASDRSRVNIVFGERRCAASRINRRCSDTGSPRNTSRSITKSDEEPFRGGKAHKRCS